MAKLKLTNGVVWDKSSLDISGGGAGVDMSNLLFSQTGGSARGLAKTVDEDCYLVYRAKSRTEDAFIRIDGSTDANRVGGIYHTGDPSPSISGMVFLKAGQTFYTSSNSYTDYSVWLYGVL